MASLCHRYGTRLALEGLRPLIKAKAPWAMARLYEKWVEESRASVNQYVSQCTELWERNSSSLF